MKNIAIIPARSGSKGLANKNIKLLNGKHLIGYTIEAAIKSGIFDTIFVSTDSDEYANIAKGYGANVPFLRNPNNAQDNSSTWDVVKEVLCEFAKRGEEFNMFTILQPTSPLRDDEDILNAYNMYKDTNASAIISVCELDHSINICNVLPDNLSMLHFLRDESKYARQMNEKYYRLNGAIYMCDTDLFMTNNSIYNENSYAYIMSKRNSIDIDDAMDFKIAEIMIKFDITHN